MNIETKVRETISKYKLFSKKDKIVVALSGGKDSTSVIYILHNLGYNVNGLFIDLHLGDWSEKNLENVRKFCEELKVPLHVFDMKKEMGSGICFIKDVVRENKGMTGCSVCGILKRWILNKTAREMGGTKLVTGHNLDDEAQTVLMNFLKGNVELGFNSGPKTGIDRKGFIQRVKPLFFVPENEIREYSKKMKFPVLYERCPCAFGTYRVETRAWLDKISDEEKLRVVNGWMKIISKMKPRKNNGINVCKNCGAPCRGVVCKACEVLSCIRVGEYSTPLKK